MSPTLGLSTYAAYRCRSSGACCTSAWPIDVEPEVERVLTKAISEGRLRPRQAPALRSTPEGTLLGLDGQGRCAFFEPRSGNLCAIHRRLGPEALPSACRHFPRVVLVTSEATKVTFSHYCPTAAGLLFELADRPTTVVCGAPGFSPGGVLEGLEAREGLPPLLRPGVLMSWASYDAYERHALDVLTRPGADPIAALGALRRSVERARAWTPADGAQETFLRRALGSEDPGTREPVAAEPLARLHATVAACAVAGRAGHEAPSAFEAVLHERVLPAWTRHRVALGRFLAAHAFASWCALQGPGLRTTLRALHAAFAVLCVETARSASLEDGEPEPVRLLEATRRADLLLRHLADPRALGAALGADETRP